MDDIVNEEHQFVIQEGKTYTLENETYELFGDFVLKLLGEIKSESESNPTNIEGYWLACCGASSGDRILYRNVVLSAGTFDTKCRFIQELRKKFGGGTFNLGGNVGGSKLADYYSYLKEDVENDEPRFFKATHLGYQGGGYWLLSKDLHVENGRVLQMEEFKYFIIDDNVYTYVPTINQSLLLNNYGSIKAVCKRYIQLSEAFGLNSTVSKLGVAFLLSRNMRCMNDNAWTKYFTIDNPVTKKIYICAKDIQY